MPLRLLNYHSGSGQGMLGLGWSLNVPAIERATVQGQPRYQHHDPLTLAGQPLVALTDGSYATQTQGQVHFPHSGHRELSSPLLLSIRPEGHGFIAHDSEGGMPPKT